MDEHLDTGTGWPDRTAEDPAVVDSAPPATEAAVPEPVADEEPAREWDVDGPDTAAGTEPIAAPQPTTRQREPGSRPGWPSDRSAGWWPGPWHR